MKIKKGLFVLSLLSAAFVFASCDKKNDNNANSDKTSDTSKIEEQETKFIVTFNSNGGSEISSQEIEKDGKASQPAAPTKAADDAATYTFAGWYKDAALTQAFDFVNDAITSDITLYAKWNATAKEYTVTFVSNGGTEVAAQTLAYGSSVTQPTDPTREATSETRYAFAGWYKDAALTQAFNFATDKVSGALTLYAKWTETDSFSVIFDTNGGSSVQTQLVFPGEYASRPTTNPTKEEDDSYSYVFAGWYTDNTFTTEFDFTQPITTTTHIYAKWDIDKEFALISIYDGDSDNRELIEVQKLEIGKGLLAQLKTPKRDGYLFIDFHIGYSTSPFAIPEAFIVEEELDIYGEWEKLDMNSIYNCIEEESDETDYSYFINGTEAQQANFYQSGFVEDKIPDFSIYENTSAYVKVTSAEELINALLDARIDYTSSEKEAVGPIGKKVRNNVRKNETNWVNAITKGLYLLVEGEYVKIPEDTPWDPDDTYYTSSKTYYEDDNTYDVTIQQTLNKLGKVHVIEIMNDIDLGYYKLSTTLKNSGIVDSFCSKYDTQIAAGTTPFSVSSMLKEYGISQIKVSNTNNLLIYSKNGAKITHAGFKVESSDRVVFRNLEMDEIWQWEDSASTTPNFTVGDMDVFGWAYFKIAYCGYIWIDHCTFGKSYDGQIDVSNPYFYSAATASRAPYGVPEAYDYENSGGVHISNCRFNSGSDDKDGYLYKMMEEIEADYQLSLSDTSYSCKYLYYKTLRDKYKLSFEDILYGVAIPQKKAFLLGDSSESKAANTYRYNLSLKVSFTNNIIIDIEDRLPNVRGGFAYLANCVIDNSRYYTYRAKLISAGASNISSYNSKYKLALVSQGIVGGYGASIYAKNCIFIGIDSLLKNNNDDKDDITADQMVAGYNLVNCIWYNDKDSANASRIIDTISNPSQVQSTVSQKSPMNTTYFSWHNENNEEPFEISLYDINYLTRLLVESQHVGTNSNYGIMYLYTDSIYCTIK